MRSLIARRMPFGKHGQALEDSYNYVDIDDLYVTSGQSHIHQFSLINDADYETVINLFLNNSFEHSVEDDAGLRRIWEPFGICNDSIDK